MTQYVRTTFQLKDQDGKAITGTGGQVHVATADSAAKATLTDVNGVAASNAVALVSGGAEFYVVNTVAEVDLYIQAPDGQFVVKKGVATGGHYDVVVDLYAKAQVYVIPFAAVDLTAATETDTGFVLPAHSQVLGKYNGLSIRVATLEAAETITVGTLESGGAGGGDADGLVNAVTLAAAAHVVATEGALFSTSLPYIADTATEKSISVTTSAGTAVAKGFAILPVVLE
jgi:hypothetical protein